MGGKWWLREYKEGDEQSISGLYRLVFNEEVNIQNWVWQYKRNPAGKPIIGLAESSQGLVGYYALMPIRMLIRNKICIEHYSLEAMTHPDYGGQGIFTTLGKEIYEIAARRGTHFLYAFTNEKSHPAVVNKLGHRDIYKGIPLWVKPLNWESIIRKCLVDNRLVVGLGSEFGKIAMTLLHRPTQNKPKYSVREVPYFDERFNSFWEEASDYNIMVVRDKQYLTWRYIEKPGEKYAIFIVERGEKLSGYLVLKCMEKFSLQIGFIMDLLTVPGEPQAARDLVSTMMSYFERKGMDIVGCLMLPGTVYSRILKEAGFFLISKKLLPQDMYWTAFNIASPSSFLFEPSNWFVTWGDHNDNI